MLKVAKTVKEDRPVMCQETSCKFSPRCEILTSFLLMSDNSVGYI